MKRLITLCAALCAILSACSYICPKPAPPKGSVDAYKAALEQCRANELGLIEAIAAYRKAVQELQSSCR